jgi:hypothetical protein
MLASAVSVAVPPLRHGREIVLLAEHEAREHGFGFLDSEHLLVASVVLCEGMPRFRDVLDEHRVSSADLRDALRSFVGAAPTVPHEPERVVCTPAVMRVLATAQRLAGPSAAVVRPHHVVLAVLDGIDDPFLGGAGDTLAALGVDPRRFRRALRRAARRA